MDLSNGSFETRITCGILTATTKRFNQQTTIQQIREYICNVFRSSLLESYRIVYYDTMTMLMVDLEDQFKNGLNLFQINSEIGVQDTESISTNIHLLVTKNTSSNSYNQSYAEVQIDRSIDRSSLNDETKSESYLSVDSVATNCDVSQEYSNDSFKTMEALASDRLSFSLDVKPVQRDIYRTDQYRIGSEEHNGRIARIQGTKELHQNRTSVLPILRIPAAYQQSNTTLVIVAVFEKLVDGIRIWYKHPRKGFLRENYRKDTEAMNPIEFDLNQRNLTADEDFSLNLTMITKWDKSCKEAEEFYRLDDKKTVLLHSTPHEQYSPRLLCVLKRNNSIDWKTFCLSDFMRSPKSLKQVLPEVTTNQIPTPHYKRLKIHG